LGEESVLAAISKVRTLHTRGCGGLSDLWDLNGAELRTFLKQQCSQSALEASGVTDDIVLTKIILLTGWMEKLEQRLLTTDDWSKADLADFRCFLDEIHQNWTAATDHQAFPKLHMLRHAWEFAEEYKFLGRVSEAQIESFHAQFNKRLNKHHHNMSQNLCQRMRRSLADAVVAAVGPISKLKPRRLFVSSERETRHSAPISGAYA
jgi:hypothetical protein